MMRKTSPLVVLAIVALCAAGALGREAQTVHIRVGNAQGSGVLCGYSADKDKRVILTVAHVVGTRVGSESIVTVGDQRYLARLIGADRANDAAALWIRNSGEVAKIPPATMYLGEIRTTLSTYSEGFSGGKFLKRRGYAHHKPSSNDLVSTSVTTFGMSGGATYIDRGSEDAPPRFIYLNSRSDLQTYGVGPETGFLYRWLPQIEHPDWKLTCNSSGLISMSPRRGPAGIIRRAVVTPEPRSAPASPT